MKTHDFYYKTKDFYYKTKDFWYEHSEQTMKTSDFRYESIFTGFRFLNLSV